MDSISKRYSACGARVGALVTRNVAILDSALRFAQARLSPPTLGQILGEAATETPDSYFEAVKAEYVHRRDITVQALQQMEGSTQARWCLLHHGTTAGRQFRSLLPMASGRV